MSNQNYPDENQNYPDENISDNVLPDVIENSYNLPNPTNFDPQAFYFFRYAHDPSMFLRIRSTSNPIQRDFTVTPFNAAQPQTFRYRFLPVGATGNFRVSNTAFSSTDQLMVFGNIQQLVTAANGGVFLFTEVRNGIYQFHLNTNSRFIGLDNAVTANNPSVFARANYTPLEREWFITTDPFAPLPPLRPIEEGIYTIHTTRLPTSAIETPQSINQESEPFIRKFDGNFHQLWQFVYDNALNAYQIINYTDQCLFAYDSGIPGTPPRQRYRLRFTSRLNQTDASYFYVNPADDGSYTLVSVKYPDQKFDLTLGITTDFNRVQLYQQNDYEAQNWLLKRVV